MSTSGNDTKGGNGSENDNTELSASNTVPKSCRLPEFWDKTPQVWFIKCENLFKLKGIKTDSTKYQHILSALPQDVVMSVLDIVKDESNGYEELKKALIARNSLSEEQRLNTLLSESNAVMGERRPSEFFRHLEQLADSGTEVNKELLLKLWMRRLPSTLNVSLVASCQTDPTILIPMADKIWDTLHKNSVDALHSKSVSVRTPNAQVASTSVDQTASLCAGLTEICQQMNALRMEINELKHNQNNRERPRQRSFSRPRNFNRSKSRDQRKSYENCWYHFKFGSNARECRPPCNFNKRSDSGKDFSKN